MASSISAINVHLIGKQGSGKSATGNSLLQSKVFRSRQSSEAVTIQTQAETSHVANRLVRVWDGPGVTENRKLTADIVRRLKQTVQERRSEPHILLWVIRYGEPCGTDDESLLSALKDSFDQKFMKANAAVVVTHKDNFDLDVENTTITFDHWAGNQTGFFKKLCRMCDDRFLPINNRSKSDEQVQRLLSLIMSLSSATLEDFSLGKEDHKIPSQSTTSNLTRPLPTPSASGRNKQIATAPNDRQAKLEEDDGAALRRQVDQLLQILSNVDHEAQLASLMKVRDELTACRCTVRKDLLLALTREVDREIGMCQAAKANSQQTKDYLNQLAHALQRGATVLGPL